MSGYERAVGAMRAVNAIMAWMIFVLGVTRLLWS